MANPNTAPERIELPNGCYWQPITKDTGYIFDAKGRYLTDVIGVTEANNLRIAMSPAPSADAVECAEKCVAAMFGAAVGWHHPVVERLIQQYADAQVAKLKAAPDGLREALEEIVAFEERFRETGSNFQGQCGPRTPLQIAREALAAQPVAAPSDALAKSLQDIVNRWKPLGGLKSCEAMAEVVKLVEGDHA